MQSVGFSSLVCLWGRGNTRWVCLGGLARGNTPNAHDSGKKNTWAPLFSSTQPMTGIPSRHEEEFYFFFLWMLMMKARSDRD